MANKPRTLVVRASDESDATNVSEETWYAYKGEVEVSGHFWTPDIAAGGGGGGLLRNWTGSVLEKVTFGVRKPRRRRPEPKAPPEELSAAQVEEMLGDSASWVLAVDYGDGTGVLKKEDVARAWDGRFGRVNLDVLQKPDEKLRENALKQFEGGAAGVLASPLAAAITALTAAAGGLGFLTQPDFVRRPWALLVAAICLFIAFVLSLVGQLAKKRVRVRAGRLDLLRAQAKPTRLERAAVGLFILAVIGAGAFALVAIAPFGGEDDPTQATIGKPVATERADEIQVKLTVTWTGLGESAKEVRTTVVTLPQRELLWREPANKLEEGTATQEVDFRLKEPATIEVTTEALDAEGATVENERREFEVP